jgi:hypothetical protein
MVKMTEAMTPSKGTTQEDLQSLYLKSIWGEKWQAPESITDYSINASNQQGFAAFAKIDGRFKPLELDKEFDSSPNSVVEVALGYPPASIMRIEGFEGILILTDTQEGEGAFYDNDPVFYGVSALKAYFTEYGPVLRSDLLQHLEDSDYKEFWGPHYKISTGLVEARRYLAYEVLGEEEGGPITFKPLILDEEVRTPHTSVVNLWELFPPDKPLSNENFKGIMVTEFFCDDKGDEHCLGTAFYTSESIQDYYDSLEKADQERIRRLYSEAEHMEKWESPTRHDDGSSRPSQEWWFTAYLKSNGTFSPFDLEMEDVSLHGSMCSDYIGNLPSSLLVLDGLEGLLIVRYSHDDSGQFDDSTDSIFFSAEIIRNHLKST